MLDYAQKRAIEALKIPHRVVLATSGPAGLLVSEFPCEAMGLKLYLLLPKTSDHLFNLEHGAHVSLVTDVWELKGEAHIISSDVSNLALGILKEPDAELNELVQIDPDQIHFRRLAGWGNLETIDLA